MTVKHLVDGLSISSENKICSTKCVHFFHSHCLYSFPYVLTITVIFMRYENSD